MSELTIADKLKALRSKKGVNQDIAAEACEISRIGLARYETGQRVPRAEIVSRLADYYGVTVDYLLGREDAERAEQGAPPPPKVDIMVRSSMPDYIAKLTPENRAALEQYARFLFEQQQK